MDKLMSWLNGCFPFSNSKTFYWIFAVSTIFNPIAVWIQTIKAWTAPSVEGLALPTFLILGTLQGIGVFYGVRIKEPALFLSMLLSVTGSTGTLFAILVR